MDLKPHIHAGLFGIGGSSSSANGAPTATTATSIGQDIANAFFSIQFTAEELSAIMTVINMALKAIGLAGLADVVNLIIRMEQGLVAQHQAAKKDPPAAKA